jgi:two-component system response regulator RstA
MSLHGARILIVEDDPELGALAQEYLRDFGFQVALESNGKNALQRVLTDPPALVILDVMLPGEDGFSICRQLRPRYRGPVLMLTARCDVFDQVLGLELGADDYMTKPFEPRLLLARVRALLRRDLTPDLNAESFESDAKNDKDQCPVIIVGSVRIEVGARTVRVAGQAIELTDPQYDLLLLLARNAGQILSRQEIFLALRGIDYDGQNRAIDILVSQLRNKIADDPSTPKILKTVRNRGYLFARTSANEASH